MIKIKNILTFMGFLCFLTNSIGQEQHAKLTNEGPLIQFRFFHDPINYVDAYKTVLDLGIGTNWNLRLRQGLSMNVALVGSFVSFKNKNTNQPGTLYISQFKRSKIHYFYPQEVRQISMETPISLQIEILKIKSSSYSMIVGINPQFQIYSEHIGKSFDKEMKVTSSVLGTNSINNASFPVLMDLFYHAGIKTRRTLQNSLTLMIETGFEYSNYGKSSGLYVKTGIEF